VNLITLLQPEVELEE